MIPPVGTPVEPWLQFTEITTEMDTHRIFITTKGEEQQSYWRQAHASVAKRVESLWEIKLSKSFDLFFITSRPSKMVEFKKLLAGVELQQAPMKLPTLDQEENLIKVAVYRLFQAFKQLQKPCFIEEAALNVEDPRFLRPFPGHNYRVTVEEQIGKKAFAAMFEGRSATTLSVLAYTADGVRAHVFTGETKGTIINPQGEKWVEVDGWDPFFCPSGYSQSLAELREFKHIVNMRLLPCAEMRSVLRERHYPGVYEVHVTVYNCGLDILKSNGFINPREPSEEYKQQYKLACTKLGVKALLIGMDDASKPMQLQTAAYHAFADFTEAVTSTNLMVQELLKLGFPPLRVRLEAMLFNRETPKIDEEAETVEKSNYFEFHARLVEVLPERLSAFQDILAFNCKEAIGTTGKGIQKVYFSTVGGGTRYFVNMRAWQIGSHTALQNWRDLLDNQLKPAGFQIAKEVKPEYCVYDQEPDLDYKKMQ